MVSSALLKSVLLTQLIQQACALLPISKDRFVESSDCYEVSEIVQAPVSFQRYMSSKENVLVSKQQQVLTSNTTQTTNTQTILNMIPGLSVLQSDANNECYYVDTIIGEKEYPLIIDTGSAYLWVYGDDCEDPACSNEALYTPTASSSASETATSTFQLAYVTGTASGEIMSDNIIVNKMATTQKFRFGMANSVPDFFAQYPVSGIFGLPSNDSSSIESIVSALYDSHAIGVKRFSISMGQINKDDTYLNNSGIFAVGDPVSELYTGDFHYTSLTSNADNYWLIELSAVYIDTFKLTFDTAQTIGSNTSYVARSAIIDSGTTVLVLPKQDALSVHSYFANSITDGSNFAVLCNSTLDLSFEINGKNFTVTSEEYLGNAYAEDSGYYGYCVSNIQGVDSYAQNSWILGAVFLKTSYLDFDISEQRVGFATKNTNVYLTSTATTTSAATATASTTLTASVVTGSTTASHTTYKDSGVAVGGASLFSAFVSSILLFLL
ncbi:hypothetical protein WICPIJ_008505 [Wickerhamomyces pijperi]|uniref:Peptidase A1 domain-containing protein n=1 Tax=Wickerhamomyces pijperi TaxID=599730 RepID=A0A9P8THK1_WICPI|nr:hypothetical protein WICPIJ_008505 [Wickerhamomyces pijperi]